VVVSVSRHLEYAYKIRIKLLKRTYAITAAAVFNTSASICVVR